MKVHFYAMIIIACSILSSCNNRKNKQTTAGTSSDIESAPISAFDKAAHFDQNKASSEETMNESPPAPSNEKMIVDRTPIAYDVTHIPKKIITNAYLTMELSNYKKDKLAILNMVDQSGGFISSEKETNNEYRIENVLSIKIPAEKFTSTNNSIEDLAKKIDLKEVIVDDITGQYVDQSSRLKTKKEVLLRYKEILKKANSVEEILDVEEHLRYLEEEIESTESQLKQMDHDVAYSTLTLTIYKENGYVPNKKSFFSEIGNSISNGWNNMLNTLLKFISIWPALIVLSSIGYITYRIVKKRRLIAALKK